MKTNKALWVDRSQLKLGISSFGKHGVSTGSTKQIVHDGDTVNVILNKNIEARFLGIDTPEISFQLPNSNAFVSTKDDRWGQFFSTNEWRNNIQIDAGLMEYLQNKIGDGIDIYLNHNILAKEAQHNLENFIEQDLISSGKDKAEFSFFMAFAHEFLDCYGRLLCYLHANKDNFNNGKGIISYNEKQIEAGYGEPYFIWPNIQPFIRIKPFSKDNVVPSNFWSLIKNSTRLDKARQSFREARKKKLGVFRQEKELKLSGFELRFLSRKRRPERYVINLSNIGTNEIISPEKYYTIKNAEDRLFIPAEYVPIFEQFGWNVAI